METDTGTYRRDRVDLKEQPVRLMPQPAEPIQTKDRTYAGPSAYLDLTRKNASRKALVKLRISSHKPLIETGRYHKIPRNERVCNVCNCKTIEDEIHFLLDCPSYSSLRDMFFTKIEPSLPFPQLLPKETLLYHIMNSTDYFINTRLTLFPRASN